MGYEAVIGLEIHLELNCMTKMFCNCPNLPGDEPNLNTCPICLWFPGAIPQFSHETLEKAVITSLALNCEIQKESAFDQKVYYYPDLPKGFQLSQAHRPLARHGWLDIIGMDGRTRRLRIRHVHMEEDVAKLVHETEGRTPISLVDFNRAGVPLVEIVTEPDMRSPHDAMEFIRALRMQIRYAGSADCSMEAGTMRVDANISIRPEASEVMNTKVEVKNMNSIRHLGDAIAYEMQRQEACVRNGEAIVLHTRLWDPDRRMTTPMRGKFEGPCVPDPSVPAIRLSEEWISEMKSRLPEMPGEKVERFINQYGLSRDEAVMMSSERDLSEYFESVVKENIAPRLASHWVATQLLPLIRERQQNIAESPVTPARLAALLSMLAGEEINTSSAKIVLTQLFERKDSPEAIVQMSGFSQVSDKDELDRLVDRVMADNPSAVEDFRNGQAKALGFLIGRAMQASQGKANPKMIREILTKKLG
ncbi:MAG: Asp-tRNA(Asn)/Glu-tRNA(Gln) amidotransferase subunit GatB [Deltaproteobacteria bacterium]|nr:Asp-tRNA(Asn)/Glu-tRNA(Gln) amidotransferase subunit GatB [Deltaproteobacteria bacterium]